MRVPRALQELAALVDRAMEELSGELGCTPTTAEIARRCEVSVEQVLEASKACSAHFPDSLDRPAHGDDDDEDVRGAMLGGEDPASTGSMAGTRWMTCSLGCRSARPWSCACAFARISFQREIAERVGLSQMQVSRVIQAAIEVLRDAPA